MNLIVNSSHKTTTLRANTVNQLNSSLINALSLSLSQKLINSQQSLTVLSGSFSTLVKTSNLKNYPTAFYAFFGSGFSQNASSITIQKSQLTALIAESNNHAESLIAAMFNRWRNLTTYDENGKIQVKYWGRYQDNSNQVDVMEVDFFVTSNKTNGYEIATPTSTLNPSNF